jgi:hypothetical protein
MLPASILATAVRRPLGGISIIGGAGCSFEEPTGIPLSRRCSEDAFHQLVLDGLLSEGECADPSDLSQLADLVFAKFGTQRPLVDRLPLNLFRLARANDGYLLLAALFRESVIASFVTLNFDLVALKALSDVGAINDVAIIRGPEEHANHRTHNVIFLHRSVDAPADDWILRTAQLDTAWRDGWQELVALRVVSNPINVFIGLGTPAAVLIESVAKVRARAPGGTAFYQVDVGNKEDSAYFRALNLPDANYIQMGWTQFMEELSERVLAEQILQLDRGCREALAPGELDDGDLEAIKTRISAGGLLALGRARAQWMMKRSTYHPFLEPELPFLASVLIAIRTIEKHTHSLAEFRDSAVVEFREGAKICASAAFVVAMGQRWLALEPRIHQLRQRWGAQNTLRANIFVCGAVGERPSYVTVPERLVPASDADNIVEPAGFDVFDIEELRADPALVLTRENLERHE